MNLTANLKTILLAVLIAAIFVFVVPQSMGVGAMMSVLSITFAICTILPTPEKKLGNNMGNALQFSSLMLCLSIGMVTMMMHQNALANEIAISDFPKIILESLWLALLIAAVFIVGVLAGGAVSVLIYIFQKSSGGVSGISTKNASHIGKSIGKAIIEEMKNWRSAEQLERPSVTSRPEQANTEEGNQQEQQRQLQGKVGELESKSEEQEEKLSSCQQKVDSLQEDINSVKKHVEPFSGLRNLSVWLGGAMLLTVAGGSIFLLIGGITVIGKYPTPGIICLVSACALAFIAWKIFTKIWQMKKAEMSLLDD